MKIVVIGGSGLIDAKLVVRLRDAGHDVVAASPKTAVDAVTGEGLATALDGAAVMVDAANSPSFADDTALDFFECPGRASLRKRPPAWATTSHSRSSGRSSGKVVFRPERIALIPSVSPTSSTAPDDG